MYVCPQIIGSGPEIRVGVPPVRLPLLGEVRQVDVSDLLLLVPQPALSESLQKLELLRSAERREVGLLHEEDVDDVLQGAYPSLEEVELVIGEGGVDDAARLRPPPQLLAEGGMGLVVAKPDGLGDAAVGAVVVSGAGTPVRRVY